MMKEHLISRRTFIKGMVVLIATEVLAYEFLRPERSTSVDPEFAGPLGTLQNEFDISIGLINTIKDRYSLPAIHLPAATALAQTILAQARFLRDGLRFGNAIVPYADIEELLLGPTLATLERNNAVPAVENFANTSPVLVRAVDDFYSSFVAREQGRIAIVRIGGEENYSQRDNSLTTQMGNPRLDILPEFVHEIVHGTDPSLRYMNYDYASDQYHASGLRLSETIRVDNEWLSFIADEREFIKTAIFSTQGDELHKFLEQGSIDKVMHELKAMATTNLLLGTSFINDKIRIDQFNQTLARLDALAGEQLGFTVNGWNTKQPEADWQTTRKETRERMAMGMATSIAGLLSDKTRKTFLRATGEDLRRFIHAGDDSPGFIFLNNHDMGDGMKIDWDWNNPDMAHDDYPLVAGFSNLLRYYGTIFWPDGIVRFNKTKT